MNLAHLTTSIKHPMLKRSIETGVAEKRMLEDGVWLVGVRDRCVAVIHYGDGEALANCREMTRRRAVMAIKSSLTAPADFKRTLCARLNGVSR